MTGLQEDNKNLKISISKVEGERKQAQERSNNLEKVCRFSSKGKDSQSNLFFFSLPFALQYGKYI